MTITRIAPNAVIVSHKGHYKTFVNTPFIMLVDWAMNVQMYGKTNY